MQDGFLRFVLWRFVVVYWKVAHEYWHLHLRTLWYMMVFLVLCHLFTYYPKLTSIQTPAHLQSVTPNKNCIHTNGSYRGPVGWSNTLHTGFISWYYDRQEPDFLYWKFCFKNSKKKQLQLPLTTPYLHHEENNEITVENRRLPKDVDRQGNARTPIASVDSNCSTLHTDYIWPMLIYMHTYMSLKFTFLIKNEEEFHD